MLVLPQRHHAVRETGAFRANAIWHAYGASVRSQQFLLLRRLDQRKARSQLTFQPENQPLEIPLRYSVMVQRSRIENLLQAYSFAIVFTCAIVSTAGVPGSAGLSQEHGPGCRMARTQWTARNREF